MSRQIVGISLVRNEDLYIRQAITNVAEFCDRIIILDNCSTDQTSSEIAYLRSRFPKIECHRIKDYRDSHQYISPYVGTDTWAFGVDGDEIYDPIGLQKFREKLLNGTYNRHWTIFGNAVHCVAVELDKGMAVGYQTPPCRSMTKLFNFSALESWHGTFERFHGDNKIFRSGFDEGQRLSLYEKYAWEMAWFRCLHLCFVRRSTGEKKGSMSRLQPDEKPEWLKLMDKAGFGWLFAKVIQQRSSPWKDERYRRGKLVTVDTASFFPRHVS